MKKHLTFEERQAAHERAKAASKERLRSVNNEPDEEAEEQGVGKAGSHYQAAKKLDEKIEAAASPEIDTSRPVEFENGSGGLEYVGTLRRHSYPLVYSSEGYLIQFTTDGLCEDPSLVSIRNVPEEPKRIKGWVVATDGNVFDKETALAVAQNYRDTYHNSAGILEIDLADGEGLS